MQYFYNPICKSHINYLMSYGFFFTFLIFGYFLIIFNVFNFHYGANEMTVKLLFSIFWVFLAAILSRCFCIFKEKPSVENNNILYDEITDI